MAKSFSSIPVQPTRVETALTGWTTPWSLRDVAPSGHDTGNETIPGQSLHRWEGSASRPLVRHARYDLTTVGVTQSRSSVVARESIHASSAGEQSQPQENQECDEAVYDCYVFQKEDINAYQVWKRFKEKGVIDITWAQFQDMNSHLTFNALSEGARLRLPNGTLSKSGATNASESKGPKSPKGPKIIRVAWTIDDGPTKYTPDMKKALDISPVTWFIVSSNLGKSKESRKASLGRLLEIQRAGGEIAIHSMHASENHVMWFPNDTHKSYPSIDTAMADLGQFHKELKDHGVTVKFVRPPGGLVSEMQGYARKLGFHGDDAIAAGYGVIAGDSFDDLLKGSGKSRRRLDVLSKKPATEQAAARNWYQQLHAGLQVMKTNLSTLDLLLWGGSEDPNKIANQDWGAETSGVKDRNDTTTGKVTHEGKRRAGYRDKDANIFEKIVDSMKDNETRALVVLAHDTTPEDTAAVKEDKQEMERYAAKKGVLIQYHTMSSLFEKVTGEKIDRYDVRY
jgi:peptidoglycan/xylan/chitin deacetylase (PgdA/CDA1 family)